MATKLKAVPHEQTNGYVSLGELLQMKPVEADEMIDGRKFRVRGLTSGEVNQITRLTRQNPLPIGNGTDDWGERSYTVAMGLVKPDLGGKDNLEAARIIVDGMEPLLRDTLCGRIRGLTWGFPGPDASAVGEDDDGEGDGTPNDGEEDAAEVDLDRVNVTAQGEDAGEDQAKEDE